MPEYINAHAYMAYLPPSRAGDYQRYHWTGEKHPAPREVEAFFSLSPRARIVIDPDHGPRPVCFLTGFHNQGHPGREHIVVAREWGDLTWPVWLERQHHEARAAGMRLNRALWKPVTDAIKASARRIIHPIDRESRYGLA